MWARFIALTALVILQPFWGLAPKRPEAFKQEPAPSRSAALKPGELLKYEIIITKIITSTVGELTLSISQAQSSETVPAKPDAPGAPKQVATHAGYPARDEKLVLEGQLTSRGFFTWLFGINVKDTYQSVVNGADFGVLEFTKTTDQGKTHREERTVISRQDGMATYTDTDLDNNPAQPKVKAAACPPWVLDILSAFYYVRTRDLREGEKITIPMTDAGRVFNIDITAGKYERVDYKKGKVRALPVDVAIFDGKYVKRSGELTVWLADSAGHVPVRAKVKVNGVTINVVLEQMPAAS